jgi:cytochrome c
MWSLHISLAAAILTVSFWTADTGTAARGRELYQRRCTGCHSLDRARVGPALRGVFGRRSAADPTFPYSDALKRARLVWDEPSLDRWLRDPDTLVPDNDMAFRLEDASERAAIIGYLKQIPSNQSRR